MTDSLRISDALTATREDPAQHIANAIQVLWAIRDRVDDTDLGDEFLSELAYDFAACERRLMVALTMLRPVVTPLVLEPVTMVNGEDLDD